MVVVLPSRMPLVCDVMVNCTTASITLTTRTLPTCGEILCRRVTTSVKTCKYDAALHHSPATLTPDTKTHAASPLNKFIMTLLLSIIKMASSVAPAFISHVKHGISTSNSNPWKLRTTLILLLVVFVYVSVTTMVAASRSDRAHKYSDRKCKLLVVVSNPGSTRCRELLEHIEEKAHDATQIRVVVVERPEPDSASKYLRHNKDTRLRINTVINLGGGSEHRRLGVDALEDEQYLVFICADAVLVTGWDVELQTQLQQCEALCSAGETPMLTSALTSRPQETFLALDDGDDGCLVPNVVPIIRQGVSSTPITSPVWSSVFSVAVAETWRQHNPYTSSTTDACGSAEDVVVSAKLWAAKIRFFLPTATTAIVSHRTRRRRETRGQPAPTVLRCFAIAQYQRYEQFVGIACSRAWISPRARMGIANEADPDEWLAKYGSKTEMQRVYKRLLFTADTSPSDV